MQATKLSSTAVDVNQQPTPTSDQFARRLADFELLGDALEYAGQGRRGLNFYDGRGRLAQAYLFRDLHRDALQAAYRLIPYGVKPGDRVALVAETSPEFAALFFGAVYAGAWPVPLPLPTSFGRRKAYIDQLSNQLASSEPKLLLYSSTVAEIVGVAASAANVAALDWESFADRAAPPVPLPEARPADVAYLQYSSGSTRSPKGIEISHRALLSNLGAHSRGVELCESDRLVSWLPWYHDMGLVGCLLSPVANQVSTDYLKTEDFARRPLAWLDLISRAEGTAVSYSPSFGYEICARRASNRNDAPVSLDLSRWRVAGNGADTIRPDILERFVDVFAGTGFNAQSFLPSYGLAEATLAVSIMPPGQGVIVDHLEENLLSGTVGGSRHPPKRDRAIVNCGKPVCGMDVDIRDEEGRSLPERSIGNVHVRGPAIMSGYFRDEEASRACVDPEGWLNTGDMGYVSSGYIYIVGRAKDVIIINGKNHWPQDLEWEIEQLPGMRSGDIAAFSVIKPCGEETPAVLVQSRTTKDDERERLRRHVRERVRAVTGADCEVELVPPRTLPRTSSGKLSRTKARSLFLAGDLFGNKEAGGGIF